MHPVNRTYVPRTLVPIWADPNTWPDWVILGVFAGLLILAGMVQP